ncbi:Hypothetical predicted protein, partial [Pelobates cultripes]
PTKQIKALHAPIGLKRLVDLEHDLFGHDFPSLYIWVPKQARPQPPHTTPALDTVIAIWNKLSIKHGLTSNPSPLTPILRNEHFTPGMTPKDFAHYEDNDLVRTYQFFRNQKIIAFTDLPQTRPLTTHDFFRYLQIKNLLDTPTYKQAGNTPLTVFEQ